MCVYGYWWRMYVCMIALVRKHARVMYLYAHVHKMRAAATIAVRARAHAVGRK